MGSRRIGVFGKHRHGEFTPEPVNPREEQARCESAKNRKRQIVVVTEGAFAHMARMGEGGSGRDQHGGAECGK